MRTRSGFLCVRLAAVSALGLVSLTGCSRPAPKPKPPILPQALAQAVTRGVNAGGEQPDWTLQIRDKTLVFISPAAGALELVNTGPETAPNGGAWIAAAKAGAFKATITTLTCHDAATGLSYPFTAEVDYGGARYQGCATWPGQGLGPRR